MALRGGTFGRRERKGGGLKFSGTETTGSKWKEFEKKVGWECRK